MALTNGFGTMNEKMVRSGVRSSSISTKASIMICKFIRGMPVNKAKTKLEAVSLIKEAIPFTRFTDGVGHRRGQMASGRYPQKAALVFLKMLTNIQNNAQQKGLGEDLVIVHAVANSGNSRGRFGRHPRRKAKSTHIDIVAEEVVATATKETQKQTSAMTESASQKPKAPAKEPQAHKTKPEVKEKIVHKKEPSSEVTPITKTEKKSEVKKGKEQEEKNNGD